MSSRLESLHAQLGTLLENAQCLLADSAPTSSAGGAGVTGGHHGYYAGVGVGKTPVNATAPPVYSFLTMQAEIRTLEFWRSIIAECLCAFFYCALVLSVSTAATSDYAVQTHSAAAAGLAAAMLAACFGSVSGGHANPAVTCALALAQAISPLRAALYICAQCGGAIAGAALVLGVLGGIDDAALTVSNGTFAMEFVLTFLVVYSYCAARQPRMSFSFGYYGSRLPPSSPAHVRLNPVIVGIAYAACLMAWKGSLNPARALGSAFVSQKDGRFKQHWMFWVGPLLGGVTGAFAHEYIFNPRRKTFSGLLGRPAAVSGGGFGHFGGFGGFRGTPHHGLHDPEQVSVHSEDDMIDDLERAKQYKANIMQDHSGGASMYNSSRFYGKRPMESMYSGSKSMYNQSMYDRYDGSRSLYNGYDDHRYPGDSSAARSAAALRRTRSIHAKFPGGVTNTPGMTRRNPYDYLPDEPIGTGMGGVGVGSKALTDLATAKSATNSPRYQDNYTSDKLTDVYGQGGAGAGVRDDTIYGTRGKGGLLTTATSGGTSSVAAASDAIYESSGGYASSKRPITSTYAAESSTGAAHGRVGDYAAGGSGSRISRLRSGAGGGEFYSPQYNSISYSQQNGCSITPSGAAGGAGAGGGGTGGVSGGVSSSYHQGNY